MIEWFNNNQGFVITILTMLYVLTTIGLWFAMRHSNKLTKQYMVRLLRPFIIVDLYPDKEFLSLRVKNTGITPAQDVSVQFEEEIKVYNNKMLNEIVKNITIVAPGQEFKFLLDKKDSFLQRNKGIRFIAGKLVYKGPFSDNSYEEKVHINIPLYGEVIEIS